jgi:hypothetical protein
MSQVRLDAAASKTVPIGAKTRGIKLKMGSSDKLDLKREGAAGRW